MDLIEAIKECQDMHNLITQLSLLIASVLQANPLLLPLQITALLSYCQESHHTIGSILTSIKTLQHQVTALQQALDTANNAPADNCKPLPKSGSMPKLPPHQTQESIEESPWKGKTLPDNLDEVCQYYGKTYHYCTKCLVEGSWVSTHTTNMHTNAFG